MGRRGFTAMRQLRGILSVPPTEDGAAYERSSYLAAMREATNHYGPDRDLRT
jgi:hypothetical protein